MASLNRFKAMVQQAEHAALGDLSLQPLAVAGDARGVVEEVRDAEFLSLRVDMGELQLRGDLYHVLASRPLAARFQFPPVYFILPDTAALAASQSGPVAFGSHRPDDTGVRAAMIALLKTGYSAGISVT